MSFSQSQSVSLSEGGSVNIWKKKVKKYDCRKDEMALAPVPWSETRKKPDLVPGIWEEEEIEDLSRYIDWHRRHPHCVTPRPVKEDEDFNAGDKKIDEGNPQLVYTKAPGHVMPTPKEYLPVPLGADCDTDTISVMATEKEYNTVLYHKYELEDPWYTMSVKDQLEQSHIDGDHTTVKTRRSAASSVVSEFNREAAWQKANYGSYEGGFPVITQRNLEKLSELALTDKSALHKPAAKVGPWDTKRDFSRFTKHGTALKDYNKVALERNVAAALAAYERELAEERAALRASSSRKSTRGRSGKKRRAKSGQVVPEEGLDKYETMRRRVGTHKQIEKMTRGFVRLAKKVASHSKLQKNALETKMDLVEACNKLRTARVQAMLLLDSTDPNMKTPEDEPVLLHTLARAVRMDQISGNQRLGSEEHDTGDRKRIQQILRALLGRADVNIFGREGLTAAHLAAKGDSSKLLALLCEHKADLELMSKHDDGGMTPLMLAAKYGHVYICADLVRHQVDFNKQNALGLTALHYAGMFGQTRTAKFLLRVGADKFLRDNEGRTAGHLASERSFQASGQAISAFAVPKRDVASQLEYLVEQEAKRKKHPEGLLGALSRTRSFFESLSVANLRSELARVAALVHQRLRRWFWWAVKEVCDYFELDCETPELGDTGPDGDIGGDAEEDEDEDGEEGKQGDVDTSGAEDSEGTSRRGTAASIKDPIVADTGNSSGSGKAGGSTGAGFGSVDGFASVKMRDNADAVIGFHENF